MLAVNAAWNVVNFRAGLIRALVAHGYEVVAVAPPDAHAPQVKALGCRYAPLAMDNRGTNPLRDLLLWWRFLQLLWRERPDILLGYTVKPNLYGSLAARLLGIPVINNISGLGAVFITTGWVTRLVRVGYRAALANARTVFFQNGEDRALFVREGLVGEASTELLPGSGVDLTHFTPAPMPPEAPFRFVLVARMLRDKGVMEYVEAARQLRQWGVPAECCLLGVLDAPNPAAISTQEMAAWVAEGVVTYLGVRDDVREEIAAAHCVVLPSYREGTPRTLLEGAAMARPLITTDAVGCREVVEHGVNGLLCAPRSAESLAQQMAAVVALTPEARAEMGRRGREKMERDFDEQLVIGCYLAAIVRALSATHTVRSGRAAPYVA
jgi:glycosyltransferase involved in cell wall biosynthesis